MSSNHLSAYEDYLECDDDEDSSELYEYSGNYLEVERANGTCMHIPLDWLAEALEICDKNIVLHSSLATH